ncbi:hypothetical protein [Limnohabitans sp. 2KL-1]|uniref:hypothetical protein n=1 Tax=Limnohabitans sp. 2KL-1 TaxID=1100699 RepID=UPI0035179090
MADWNPIPSGSMRPTLLEGDVVVAELGEPQRGDFCFAQRRRALDQLLGPTLKDFIQGQT